MPEDPTPSSPSGAPTNRNAIYSVLFGVVAFGCLYVFPYGAILGVPSITTGVQARREITASKGAEGGDSTAVIGMMIGGAAIVVGLIVWAMDTFLKQ